MNVPPPPYIETTATSLTQSTSLNVPPITQTFYTDAEGGRHCLTCNQLIQSPCGNCRSLFFSICCIFSILFFILDGALWLISKIVDSFLDDPDKLSN
uniref:Uncharacterized protein n=1 Tax=Meloidogyne enterolobii TaxID=390850 RepID=A0A6V7XDY3_MELEN|nr:unnamed protein product [Meloidogyne enterolobii]